MVLGDDGEVGTLAGLYNLSVTGLQRRQTPKLIRSVLERLPNRAIALSRRQRGEFLLDEILRAADLRAVGLLAEEDVLLNVRVRDLSGTNGVRIGNADLCDIRLTARRTR